MKRNGTGVTSGSHVMSVRPSVRPTDPVPYPSYSLFYSSMSVCVYLSNWQQWQSIYITNPIPELERKKKGKKKLLPSASTCVCVCAKGEVPLP